MSNPVIGEYDSRSLVIESSKWQAAGLVLLVCHVLLVKVSFTFYPVVMAMVGWLYIRAPLAAVLVFFQILIYQNLIVAVFDADMDFVTFQALQGTNFVVLAIMALIAGIRMLPHRNYPQHRAMFISIAAALSTAFIYTIFGLSKAGLSPATIYFRFFTGAIFAGIIGLDIGRAWSFRTIGLCFLYSAVLSLILGTIEYFYPIEYYDLTNTVHFYQLKYWNSPEGNTFYTPRDVINQFTSAFFNISGSTSGEYGFDNFRFGGPLINPISNGYVISVLAITVVALRRSLWLVLLVPMLVLAGVKGAMLLLLFSIVLYWIWVTVNNRKVMLILGMCLMTAYVGTGIVFGLQRDDYHVLGFLGGTRSLVHTPAGHGFGVGGNMSRAGESMKILKVAGELQSADFAMESALGVMFYQMGIGAAAILGVFVTFLWKAPMGLAKQYVLPTRTDIMYFPVALIVFNSIFQEEAFSPYASGLIMLLASVLYANQRQAAQVIYPRHSVRRFRRPPFVATPVCLLALFAARVAWADPILQSPDRLLTLARGVNISTSFESRNNIDIEVARIAQAGFGHVRVFVLIESLDDPLYQMQLDRLVRETTDHHLGIILCMTSRISLWKDNGNVKPVWLAAWTKLAERMRATSPRYVFLELANEPGLDDPVAWDSIQSDLRKTVRRILPRHTILLTGSPTSMVWSLVDHPVDVAEDDNIVYVFHLYQPMVVTCQGCDCCPVFKSLAGLEYPPNPVNISRFTSAETAQYLDQYRRDGALMMRAEVDAASAWSSAHHVPIVADEFGVFSAASEKTRAAWLGEARQRLEKAGIGWTVWEWKGGFGVAPLHRHGLLTIALGLDHR